MTKIKAAFAAVSGWISTVSGLVDGNTRKAALAAFVGGFAIGWLV